MSLLDESLAISSELGMRPLTAYQGAIELETIPWFFRICCLGQLL